MRWEDHWFSKANIFENYEACCPFFAPLEVSMGGICFPSANPK